MHYSVIKIFARLPFYNISSTEEAYILVLQMGSKKSHWMPSLSILIKGEEGRPPGRQQVVTMSCLREGLGSTSSLLETLTKF